MKKHILFLFALTLCLPLMAQQRLKFSVTSFELEPFSTAAQDNKRLDGDGRPMSIIKVTTDNPDELTEYAFDFGNIRSDAPEMNDDELWIYVQRKAHFVTISRPGYLTVKRYELEPEVAEGKTYAMHITAQAIKKDYQMVLFRVQPADANAMILVKRGNAVEEPFGTTDASGTKGKRLEYGEYTYKVVAAGYKTTDGLFTLGNKAETHTENVVLKPNYAEVSLRVEADADIYINDELMGHGEWKGRLEAGSYTVECRKECHRSSTYTMNVDAGKPVDTTLPSPTPITGSLSITSEPAEADIAIDGQLYGQTPKIINDIIIGSHLVQITKHGYIAQERSVEVGEGQIYDMDFQLVKGSSPKPKQKPKKEEPKPKEPTPPSVGTANSRESQRSEPLPPNTLLPSTSFYVQGGIQAGSLMAVTASVGVYLGGFNIEATYGSGMSKSETMYWNHDTDPNVASRECSYNPTQFSVRVGYGIAASRSLRLTPQVGLTAVNIKADGSKGNATSATIGLRTELALARHIALFATPEVGFAVSKSDIFSQVADVSSKVKGWASGFNVRAGISISF